MAMAIRRGMRGWPARLLGAIGLLLLLAPQAGAGADCQELLQKRCQSCHSLARTCAELGRGKREWQESIAKMADYDSSISTKDQKILVKCLARQEKEVVDLCRP